MSLYQAACLGQAVAAVAVLFSLVFVGLQIRQNTRFQQLAAVDALSTAVACINTPGMEMPAMGEALAIGMQDWGAAAREPRIVAHYFLFSYFKLMENAWYQREAGMIDGWESMLRVYYHSPGIKCSSWPRRHNAFSPSFQAYLAGTSPPEVFDSLDNVFANRPSTAAKGTSELP